MLKPTRIILHCSASMFGEVRLIDNWHKERGWKGIGYHSVVLNGRPFKFNDYLSYYDGMICPGRPLDSDEWLEANEVGAHVYGFNKDSLAICMIGEPGQFTDRVITSTECLTHAYMKQFNLKPKNVIGHYELDNNKKCPGINMNYFRAQLDNTLKRKAIGYSG